jgi:hypothetical protein
MLAACRVECHHQSAQRFHTLAFQGGAQRQWRSRRVPQYHTEGIEADDEICALLERRTHALALRIAAVGHGDIARSEGEMLERFAGMDIADQHLEKLQGHQVHRDVQAMIGAYRAWGLNTTGVDDHKAPPRGQGRHGGQGEHLPEHRFHPQTTGPQALRYRLVRHGLIQGRKGACYLAQGFVQPTIQEDHPQELRGGLNLLGPHKCFEGACHLPCLRGEVLQKFLKERIWICQGQLHGYFSCRQQGKFLTLCSMPSSSMIYSLSWRECG